jgi:ribosomal protein S18 acetylase RimI-like enzyme
MHGPFTLSGCPKPSPLAGEGWVGGRQEHDMHIRPATLADAAAIARVHVDSWRTTYKGILPDDYLANLTYERRESLWREILSRPAGHSLDYVAADTPDNIVGFVSGGPERSGDPVYTGEVYVIYLLERWQGQGIGRQLTMTLVRQLMARGLTSLLIWVLAENPSRRFYEALGGRLVRDKRETTGGVQLIEVAYGWLDAQTIIDAQARPLRWPGT